MKKKASFINIIIAFMLCNFAHAQITGIDIIAQKYHVEGYTTGQLILNPDAPESDWIWENVDASYSVTDINPTTGICSSQHNCWSLPTLDELLNVTVEVQSCAENFAISTCTDCGTETALQESPQAGALAETTCFFKPQESSLDIALTPSGNACTYEWMREGFGFSLTDLTTDVLLDQDGWAGQDHLFMQTGELTVQKTFNDLDPSHQYELLLWTRTCIFGDDDGNYDLSLQTSIMPEPATLLLMGIGSILFMKR